MRAIPVLATALLLAAVAAGAWWWIGSPEPEAGVLGVGEDERAVAGAEAPLLAGRAADEAGDGDAPALATLEGEVRCGGVPVPARVEVRPLGGPGAVRQSRLEYDAYRPDLLVGVGSRDAAPAAVAEAGEDGRFAVPRMPAGSYEVRAVSPDRGEGFAAVDVGASDVVVRVTVELPCGAETLRGTARHADGRPFQGVILAAGYREHEDDDHADLRGAVLAATDADGAFTLRGLSPGPWVLHALVPGRWRTGITTVHVPKTREVHLEVDTQQREVAGRVVAAEDGRPLAGARVFAYSWEVPGWFVASAATADADGRFRLGTSSRSFTATAEAPGFARIARTVHAADREVLLALPRPSRVEGRVVRAAGGEPVAGAVVRLHSPVGGAQRATTDAEGRFAFAEGPVGPEQHLFVFGGGWTSPDLAMVWNGGFDPLRVDLAAGTAFRAELPAVPSSRARGRVLGPGDAPAAALVERETFYLLEPERVATDAEGRFAFADFPPDVNVELRAVGALGQEASETVSSPPGAAAEVEIRLPPVRFASVRVTSRGAPLAGARVHTAVQDEEEEQTDLPFVATTDAAGRARVGPLPPGRVFVAAVAPDHARSERVEAEGPPDGSRDLEAEIALSEGLSVEGTVVLPEGMSPAGATVQISDDTDEWREAQVGEDGTFRFGGLVPGYVWLWGTLYRERRDFEGSLDLEDLQGSATGLRLVLEPSDGSGEPWDVTVRAPDGGPLPIGRLGAWEEQSPSNFRWVGRYDVWDGLARIHLEEERRGRPLWLVVLAAEDAFGRDLDFAPASAALVPRDGPGEIRLKAGRAIEGTVLSPEGLAVHGAWITGNPKQRRTEAGPSVAGHAVSIHGRTDARGAFRLLGAGEAEYLLTVAVPRGIVTPEPVPAAGGATGVVIRLRRAVEQTVTVHDPRGSPVRGATVRWLPGEGDQAEVEQTTDLQGRATHHHSDPERGYRVAVVPPSDRADLAPLSPVPCRGEAVTLRMPVGHTLRILVVDEEGIPSGGAVWFTADPGRREGLRQWGIEEDGSGEMTQQPPGRLWLIATDGNFRIGPDAAWTPADVGTQDVVRLVVQRPPPKSAGER